MACFHSPADLNADGRVDAGDLALLLASWGPCPATSSSATCPADLDRSGVVDAIDLAALLARWP